MRILLVVMTCLIVAGIVMFVILTEPVPQEKQLSVSRIDITRVSPPILSHDPAEDQVLEFFPDPTTMVPEQVGEATEEEETEPQEKRAQMPRKELDMNRLLALIDDWVYVNFSQVMDTKVGRIQEVREKEFFEVHEGKTLDNGIHVELLTDESVTLTLGEASFKLPLAQKPEFFDELREKWRPLTPDEQQAAWEYYMNRYGKKFQAHSRNYEPPSGLPMPKPVSPEEREEGRQQYMELYGNRFAEESESFKPSYPGTEEQHENFEKYWRKHHPGLPMPEFEQFQDQSSQLGPGNRIQPATF